MKGLDERLKGLERFASKVVAAQQVRRDAYERNWREVHEDAARVLSADTDAEIDLARQGLVPVVGPDPEAVALVQKLERDLATGRRETEAASTAARADRFRVS